MAGERDLYFGADPTDATYRIGDDDASNRFVLAEDTDAGTILLEYDEGAGEWVSRGPVNLSGNDLSNVGTLDAAAVNTGTLSNNGSPITISDRPEVQTDLRLATGQAIEDGGGTKRLNIDNSFTGVNDDDGVAVFEADAGGSSIRVRNNGLTIRDLPGAYDAVKYLTDSSGPGTLELTNAELQGDNGAVFSTGPTLPSGTGTAVIISPANTDYSNRLGFSNGADEEGWIRLNGNGEVEASDDSGNLTTLT